MAKRLTYIQNHDGERTWTLPAFNDDEHKSEQYIYLCQHSDGNKTELDIIKIPRSQWNHLVDEVAKALQEFK